MKMLYHLYISKNFLCYTRINIDYISLGPRICKTCVNKNIQLLDSSHTLNLLNSPHCSKSTTLQHTSSAGKVLASAMKLGYISKLSSNIVFFCPTMFYPLYLFHWCFISKSDRVTWHWSRTSWMWWKVFFFFKNFLQIQIMKKTRKCRLFFFYSVARYQLVPVLL